MYFIDVVPLLAFAAIPLFCLYSRKIRRDIEEVYPSCFNELKRLEEED